MIMKKGALADSKKKLNSNIENIDDYEVEDEGFFEGDVPNLGTPIATFNFGINLSQDNKDIFPKQQSEVKKEDTPRTKNKNCSTAVRGITPPIDGEQYTLKRCYQYRPSTIRKLNELKAKHPDVNAYLNTIIDEAIVHYYNHIFNDGGKFNNRQ